jgi:hypothetical protein
VVTHHSLEKHFGTPESAKVCEERVDLTTLEKELALIFLLLCMDPPFQWAMGNAEKGRTVIPE